MNPLRQATLLTAAAMSLGLFHAESARAQSQQKVQAAADFLNATKHGKEMLGYLHMGAQYVDHDVVQALRVTDASG